MENFYHKLAVQQCFIPYKPYSPLQQCSTGSYVLEFILSFAVYYWLCCCVKVGQLVTVLLPCTNDFANSVKTQCPEVMYSVLGFCSQN